MSIRNKKLLTALLVVMFSSAPVFADDAAVTGREGQAFGNQLSGSMRFPTESGGMIEFGDESINPSEFAPSGDGFYVQDPNVGGMQGIYDSDYDMDVTGRATQGKLYSDAQAMGNPFDPDPAKRDIPGPSTVSGAAYQIVLGVSGAREKFPDLTNDPIVVGSGQAMVNEDLLESFGDCSVETEVTESTRPVRVPEEEFCERVTKPAASSCQVKHELVVEEVVTGGGETYILEVGYVGAGYIQGTLLAARLVVQVRREGGGAVVWRVDHGVGPYDLIKTDYYPKARLDLVNNPFKHAAEYCPLMGFASVADCKKAAVIINGQGGVFSVMQKYNTTTRKLIITTDRWYPEECVARAQRG